MAKANPAATAKFLWSFFNGLVRGGVTDVVISPGSRSTPLAMVAYELSRRHPRLLRVTVDVDERGAAFVALGLAKATGRPAAAICTSGTAVGNYLPAVLEAESSRVPLLLLTGDRPPHLQELGAPQTCDQLHLFGTHVRAFRQMPLPSDDGDSLAFATQAAREAVFHAEPFLASDSWGRLLVAGSCSGGPVHVNFPFDEPLKPDCSVWDDWIDSKMEAEPSFEFDEDLFGWEWGWPSDMAPGSGDLARFAADLSHARVVLMAGEGSVRGARQAHRLLDWAAASNVPVLADPLSGLRGMEGATLIDAYDGFLGAGEAFDEALRPDVVIRFGRYPVSKRATLWAKECAARGTRFVVVDPFETRDFNAATGLFLRAFPASVIRMLSEGWEGEGPVKLGDQQRQVPFARIWAERNGQAQRRIAEAVGGGAEGLRNGFEGAYVAELLRHAPDASTLFVANSMSVRAVDTVFNGDCVGPKELCVLGNRGLNGIDGTLSTAVGAALGRPGPATLLTGDLALEHDLNALALQRELLRQDGKTPSVTIVLLNNNGGAIFDMLPQKSEDAYFERLFLTPQDVNYQAAASAFGVPYQLASTVDAFAEAYRKAVGAPGLNLIEVRVPLQGLRERYAGCW